MPTDWHTLCMGSRLERDGDEIVVAFENGRKQRIRIVETESAFEIRAIVARAAAVKEVEGLPLRVWLQNRAAQLVGFHIDGRGRVCAEGWVAKAGVTKDEFQTVLRRVAAESDRFEFLLTGRDFE